MFPNLPRLVLLLLGAGALLQAPVQCARILAVFPCPSKSHLVVFSALTRELALRGHELVVVSPFPLSSPPTNYTDIDLMPDMREFYEQIMGTDLYDFYDMPTFAIPIMFWEEGLTITKFTLDNKEVKQLRSDDRGFDLVIVEDFMTESLYAFADYFKAPLVLISSLGGLHSVNYVVGNPLGLAHWPNTMLTAPLTDQMSFYQRLLNVAFTAFFDLGNWLYYLPQQEALRTQFFGTRTPSVWQLRHSASLVLLNNHFSLNYPRPLVPAVQEVGGMQIARTSNSLPSDLQKFLDGATEGAIYFSMGSNLRSNLFPAEKLAAIMDVFAELPQRVIMKWELDSMPGKPNNVKLGKWLPQQDILAHPNVRLFVTHGGLLSAQEACYHGVPLVGIPIFGDQAMNMHKAVQAGYGVLLEMSNITKQSATWALHKALYEPSISEEARRRSAVWRDQPQSPLERAVFWTEYVIRHQGAPHLRSAALELAEYQLHLLDVAAVILVPLVAVIFVLCKCCKRSEKYQDQLQKKRITVTKQRQ